MRAIQVQRVGGPEVLEVAELPAPDPGPGEVRVRHHAIGVNFIDVYQRSGLYPTALPLIPGSEGAGVVEAVGAGVTSVAAGDRVAYAASSPGSYAERAWSRPPRWSSSPTAIDFATAAAMMLKGLTVQYLLRRTSPQGGLHAGDAIVWHAAAGGVGLIACQWAKALGLRVIATAGGSEKCALAVAHGAEVRDRLSPRGRRRAGHASSPAAAASRWSTTRSARTRSSARSIASLRSACWSRSATRPGPIPPFDVLTLMRKGSLYVTRPTLGTHTREHLAEMAAELIEVVTSGQVAIEIGQRYPLADAARAHRELEARSTTGASVLLPG